MTKDSLPFSNYEIQKRIFSGGSILFRHMIKDFKCQYWIFVFSKIIERVSRFCWRSFRKFQKLFSDSIWHIRQNESEYCWLWSRLELNGATDKITKNWLFCFFKFSLFQKCQKRDSNRRPEIGLRPVRSASDRSPILTVLCSSGVLKKLIANFPVNKGCLSWLISVQYVNSVSP